MQKETNKNKSVKAKPDGFHSVTPFLIVDGAARLLEFIKNAFGGEITFALYHEDNKERVVHAVAKIGDSLIMIADTMEGMQPQTAMLYLYLEDVDAMYKKAVQAKGKPVREPQNEFYGDRAGAVQDEWGNMWWIGTHVEDVDEAELKRRSKETFKQRKEEHREVHA